jgi:hypothetical protein
MSVPRLRQAKRGSLESWNSIVSVVAASEWNVSLRRTCKIRRNTGVDREVKKRRILCPGFLSEHRSMASLTGRLVIVVNQDAK